MIVDVGLLLVVEEIINPDFKGIETVGKGVSIWKGSSRRNQGAMGAFVPALQKKTNRQTER